MKRSASHAVILLALILVPLPAFADIAAFTFTSDPQTVEVGAVSKPITITAQDGAGTAAPVPQTACLSLVSSSATGEFSSSATNWSPIGVLTMSKNSSNRNFYYKDSASGSHTLTVKATLKPDTVSSSCASWPVGEWNVQWTVTQSITIGSTSASSAQAETQTQTQTQEQSSPLPSVPSYVPPPVPTIFADAGADRTVIVGADVVFDGRAYDREKQTLEKVRLVWNFGDGSTAEGPSVRHHWDYPGRYVVVLDVAQDRTDVSDRVVVTAEPAKLAFSALPDGSVAIENRAGRDLDLSGWLVQQFSREFALPENSIILAGSSMRIPQKTLGFYAATDAVLAYPNGVVALRSGEGAASAPAAANAPLKDVPAVSVSPSKSPPPAASRQTAPEPNPAQGPDISEPPPDIDAVATSAAFVAGAAVPASSHASLWWMAAIALALCAAGTLAAAKYFGKGEWTIIDE